jgi:hypothetical protein
MKKYADFSNCDPDCSSAIEQLILALDINLKNSKNQVHPNVNRKDDINIIDLRDSSPNDSTPSIKKMKYKKGDIVEVTKVSDPNAKRGASYFVADDGNGGLVVMGPPPSIDIGQKARVEISGVMEKEGLYNFAVIDGKSKLNPRSRDKGSPG